MLEEYESVKIGSKKNLLEPKPIFKNIENN